MPPAGYSSTPGHRHVDAIRIARPNDELASVVGRRPDLEVIQIRQLKRIGGRLPRFAQDLGQGIFPHGPYEFASKNGEICTEFGTERKPRQAPRTSIGLWRLCSPMLENDLHSLNPQA